MASNHTSLDAAATERKARLAKLKSLKRKQPANEDDTPGNGSANNADYHPSAHSIPALSSKDTNQHLSGRNYDVETRGPKLGFENAPTGDSETLELRAAAITQETKDKGDAEGNEEKPLDLFTLQPKRPNWDLKRDLEMKMRVLHGRTDNAVARLVRERIESQKKKDSNLTHTVLNGADGDGENVGMKGIDLVEGVHIREREEVEEERREREVDEDLT